MKTPSLAEFLQAVADSDYTGNTDPDYLQAVYSFAVEYSLGNWDDVEHILAIAEECYAGNFARSADYGEHVGEEYFSDRLDAIQDAAIGKAGSASVHIPYTIDWEQFADLILPNCEGLNYSSYPDSEPGTGAHYFREPR